jgi:hypothetical protein
LSESSDSGDSSDETTTTAVVVGEDVGPITDDNNNVLSDGINDGNSNAAKGNEFGLALLCVFMVSGLMF